MTAPVVAVVGPSGVGKDSLMTALSEADEGLVCVRRDITRPEDAGGEAFNAVSESEFSRREAAGGYALSWGAHGLKYGVPTTIDDMRLSARGVLVNLSRSVLADAQARFGQLIVLSLTADAKTLAKRLKARGREDAQTVAQRLSRARAALPDGLRRVHVIDNSGPLSDTVAVALAALQPESV